MTTRSIIEPDPAVVALVDQLDEVAERAQPRVDAVVVGHVVAVVPVGRRVDRVEPDRADPEPGQVVQPAGQPAQVTHPVAVGVLERLDVDAVDDRLLVPPFWHGGHVPRRSGYGKPVTVLARADRRLVLRLALGLAAAVVLGVPFLLLALLVRDNWSPLIRLDTSVAEPDARDRAAPTPGWSPCSRSSATSSTRSRSGSSRPPWRVLLFWRGRRRLAIWTLVTIWGAALLGVLLKARGRPGPAGPGRRRRDRAAAGRSRPGTR